jgi:acyl carrier protein
MADVPAQLRTMIASLGRPLADDWSDDRALELASIEVVMLHDLIEQTFDIRLGVNDVSKETFATIGTLARLIVARGAKR